MQRIMLPSLWPHPLLCFALLISATLTAPDFNLFPFSLPTNYVVFSLGSLYLSHILENALRKKTEYGSQLMCFLFSRIITFFWLKFNACQHVYLRIHAYVSVSQSFHNKIPQLGDLKLQKFIISFLEARNPRSRCWKGHAPSKDSESCSLPLASIW